MIAALDIICGFSWTVVYIAAIIRGFRNKTWCIPALSICMNFSWEFCAVLERIINGSTDSLPFIIQLCWLVFDIGILASWLIYSHNAKGRRIPKPILFAAVFALVYVLTRVAGQWEFSVFLINVIMSGEFLVRLKKDDSPWISPTVAVAKLIGTLAATVLNGVVFPNMMVLWLGGICLILDSYYLIKQFNREE